MPDYIILLVWDYWDYTAYDTGHQKYNHVALDEWKVLVLFYLKLCIYLTSYCFVGNKSIQSFVFGISSEILS